MSDENLFDIRWGLAVIRRKMWLIIGLMVLTALVAYITVSLMPRQYEDSVTLLVQPARDSQLSDYNVLLASQQMAITYSEMAKGRLVLEAAIKKVGLNLTSEALASQISTVAIHDTQLVRITVRDTSPERATAIANALAEAFSDQVKTLQLDRYADTLQGAQSKMDTALAQITDAQANIDALNTQKVANDVEIARLQNSLSEQQSMFNLFQQSYQSLQLSIANLEDNVKVISPASVKEVKPTLSYVASTTLLIKEGTVASSTTNFQNINIVAPAYAEMFTNPVVLKDAVSKLGLTDSPASLAKSISAEIIPGTQFIKLNVISTSDQEAVQLADAIATSFVDQLRQKLLDPFSTNLANMQAQIDTLSKQIGETQANLQKVTSENANLEIQLGQLNIDIATYRSDFRTYQQNYDNLRLTVAAAADNVVITELAKRALPAQGRILYISISLVVSLVVGLALAFLLEAGKVEESSKRMETVTVQAGR